VTEVIIGNVQTVLLWRCFTGLAEDPCGSWKH
jgi:hypothetical protein